MKVVKKKNVVKNKIGKHCTAFEYSLGDKDINGAIAELSGRYPQEGRVVNNECKELVYILRGKVDLHIENKIVELEQGDEILIMPGEKYFWDGEAKLFMCCNPAWYPEQHEEVE